MERFGGALGRTGNESVFIWIFVLLWNPIYTEQKKKGILNLVLKYAFFI